MVRLLDPLLSIFPPTLITFRQKAQKMGRFAGKVGGKTRENLGGKEKRSPKDLLVSLRYPATNTTFCEVRGSKFAVTDGFFYFSFLFVVLFALFLS